MTDPPSPRHLFAYGTLLPGDERWPLLQRFVVDAGWEDAARGSLHDTGLGYPAAVFESGESWIVGRTFVLVESSIEVALAELDVEEDTVEGLFRRVEIATRAGHRAWAYAYGNGLELTPITTGDWLGHRGLR